MRVPFGLFLSWRMTAALSSKRMYEPSGRPYSLAWRTMTALTTSPFLTDPPGVASLTEATITSPIEASNFEPPATTRMHISSRAPVLSATRSLVCGMIIARSFPYASTSAISTGSPVPRRRICWTTQCLSLLIGRDSAITTVSPTSQRLSSSCALKLRVRRSVRPYSRWRVTISTATTTVLFILLLATRPTLVRRGLRASGIGQLPLPLQRLDPRDLAAHRPHARRVRQLARRELEAQSEHLFAQLPHARLGVGPGPGGLFWPRAARLAARARLPRLPLRHSRGPP